MLSELDRDLFIRYVHMCLRGHCVYVGCVLWVELCCMCLHTHVVCVSVCAHSCMPPFHGEDLTDSAGGQRCQVGRENAVLHRSPSLLCRKEGQSQRSGGLATISG